MVFSGILFRLILSFDIRYLRRLNIKSDIQNLALKMNFKKRKLGRGSSLNETQMFLILYYSIS